MAGDSLVVKLPFPSNEPISRMNDGHHFAHAIPIYFLFVLFFSSIFQLITMVEKVQIDMNFEIL